MVRRLVLLVILLCTLAAGYAAYSFLGRVCVASTVVDKQTAAAVGQFIAKHYGEARLRYNVRPGCKGDLTLDFYELHLPTSIARVEQLAQQAQRATPQANSVTLRFFESENWIERPGGGGERGAEKLLKQITLRREPNT